METAEVLSEDSIEILYQMGYQLYRNGKYSDAEDCFKLLSAYRLEDRRVWMGLGATYQMQQKYPEAIECYSVAALQDPNEPYVHWYAAQCLHAVENHPKALEAIRSALHVAKADPHYAKTVPALEVLESVWSKGVQP